MFLCVGTLGDDLGGGFAGDRPMQFVLDGFEERLADFRILVVVDAALFVDVGDLQVKRRSLASYLADALQEFVEVVFAETPVQLQRSSSRRSL